MKLRIYSDLHLEFGRFDPAFDRRADEQLVVLAGDIEVGAAAIGWAAHTFAPAPVVYVLGNHEFYHHNFDTLVAQCRERARGTNVHVLERDVLDVAGIRVLGCSLWTDYGLFGAERQAEAKLWARDALADFMCIRRLDGQLLLPMDAAQRFEESARWLDQEITRADRPVLVVTHHSPTAATISPLFAGQISNASFHSNADHLLRSPVRMWTHGHTHHNADLLLNGVRVVTNQWGYPDDEAPGFRRDGLFDLCMNGASDALP